MIKFKINDLDFIELQRFMKERIEESIRCVDALSDVEWYECCSMEEYFTEWDDIFDENDNLVGKGLNTISNKFILNEETWSFFEAAFNAARDDAYVSVYTDISAGIHDVVSGYMPYPEDDKRSYDFDAWVSDGEYNSCFIGNEKTYYKIKEDGNDEESWIVIYFENNLIERY